MQLNPAILSDARVLAAYIIFFASYFVFALGKFPGLKIDSPGAAIIGAVLMVAFRIMSAQEALRAIDFATIVLLFSMMLICRQLAPWRLLRVGYRKRFRTAKRSSVTGSSDFHKWDLVG